MRKENKKDDWIHWWEEACLGLYIPGIASGLRDFLRARPVWSGSQTHLILAGTLSRPVRNLEGQAKSQETQPNYPDTRQCTLPVLQPFVEINPSLTLWREWTIFRKHLNNMIVLKAWNRKIFGSTIINEGLKPSHQWKPAVQFLICF